jgi:manganese transport protein
VILSLQLGFAVIPLIHFVSDKKTMGDFVIKRPTQVMAWLIAAILVYLNLRMLFGQALEVYDSSGNLTWKIIIPIAGAGFVALLVYITFFPLFGKKKKSVSIQVHREGEGLTPLVVPQHQKIAVALDFGQHDATVLSHAIGQGKEGSTYVLIHVVESASARLLGQESDDFETFTDKERLQSYVQQLKDRGYSATAHLGFRDRAKDFAPGPEMLPKDLPHNRP